MGISAETDHPVELLTCRLLQCVFAIKNADPIVALSFEIDLNQSGDMAFIFSNQDAFACCHVELILRGVLACQRLDLLLSSALGLIGHQLLQEIFELANTFLIAVEFHHLNQETRPTHLLFPPF